jgi:hypothetical protein
VIGSQFDFGKMKFDASKAVIAKLKGMRVRERPAQLQIRWFVVELLINDTDERNSRGC